MANKKNDLSFEKELRVSFAQEYNELKITSPWRAYKKAQRQWELAEKKQREAWDTYMKLANTLDEDSSAYSDKIKALSDKVSNMAEYNAIFYLNRLDN
jgi:hypothetical protein